VKYIPSLQVTKIIIVFVLAIMLQACIKMANSRFIIKETTFSANYFRIKKIVIEEAASNGFSELTSEIKPSQFNDWNGQLFFSLVTAHGTDQLFVEFEKKANGIGVWIHGGGTRSNPNSAAKAIQARLKKASIYGDTITVKKTNNKTPGRALIMEMQTLLNKHGYDAGPSDGLVGKKTRQAVSAFQNDQSFPVTGTYNKSTMKLLRNLSP